MDNYPEQTVKERVEYALSKLFEKDAFLLQNNLNERTITHRLAMYLQEAFPECTAFLKSLIVMLSTAFFAERSISTPVRETLRSQSTLPQGDIPRL